MTPDSTCDAQLAELHDVLCQRASLVTKNISHLPKIFQNSVGIASHGLIADLVVHPNIARYEELLSQFRDFQTDIQRKRNDIVEHDQKTNDNLCETDGCIAYVPGSAFNVVVPHEIAHGTSDRLDHDIKYKGEHDLICVALKSRLLGMWVVVGVHADLGLFSGRDDETDRKIRVSQDTSAE
jgi:hypothetical protein